MYHFSRMSSPEVNRYVFVNGYRSELLKNWNQVRNNCRSVMGRDLESRDCWLGKLVLEVQQRKETSSPNLWPSGLPPPHPPPSSRIFLTLKPINFSSFVSFHSFALLFFCSTCFIHLLTHFHYTEKKELLDMNSLV